MRPPERTLRRILVALDASPSSLDALAAAVGLAASLGADLEALFVEDVNLLRAAGYSFAQQLPLPSGAPRPFSRGAVEEELRALASRAKEALASSAGRQRVAWTFRVARGQVSPEVLHAAGHADLLVLGRTSRRLGAGAGGTARAAATGAATSVLVLGREGGAARPLAVGYDGSEGSDRALRFASALASATAAPLTVLLCASTQEEAERLAQRVRQRSGHESSVRLQWIGSSRRDDLVRLAYATGSVLVVGARSGALAHGGLERILEEGDVALLLTR